MSKTKTASTAKELGKITGGCAAVFALGAALAAGASCGGGVEEAAAAATSASSSSAGGAGGGDVCGKIEEPPAPSTDVCARVAAGPAGARSPSVDLSAVHAGVRFFSPLKKYSDADQALAASLEAPDALTKVDLSAYAKGLSGVVCAVPASTTALGAATVEMSKGVAIVHPGTGSVTLPAGATAVAIDVRDLPSVPGLRDALEAAVSPALATPVPRAEDAVRKHDGMIDEVFSAMNVYKSMVVKNVQAPIPATGKADLPLAFLTGATTAPEAAEMAITLRLANRAYIYGEDQLAAVAEMRVEGVGSTSVAHRWHVLGGTGAAEWPDMIPADQRATHPECLVTDLATKGPPQKSAASGAQRSVLKPVSPFGDIQPVAMTLGTARAALIIAHGALRLFFPYFPVVGDHIDDRLDEALGSLGMTPDRPTMKNALRRFGNATSDGHQFVFDQSGSMPAGYMPVYIEDIAGEAVVRRSGAVGISAGDAITSIAGVPAAQWYQTELARTSAATDGYRFNVASRRYMTLFGPIDLGLRDPDGNQKMIKFQPQPYADFQALGFAPSMRPAGYLGDLGAPSLFYINLDEGVLTDTGAFDAALAQSVGAKGLVIDMRGYPGLDHYHVAETLIQQGFSSPIFNVPIYTGPDQKTVDSSNYDEAPIANPSFLGPIALLVGHATVSAAENFSIMLVDAKRVKVFGRRSAGTDGNITGVELPGAFGFSFTGMEVLHADAMMSQFHGIGIVPEMESTLTAKAFRDGVDPELADAVAWLLTQ